MADVLVIAPHPDDEVLGCGGSIAMHRQAERTVHVAYLTSGEAGSAPQAHGRLRRVREGEARAATDVLGIDRDGLSFLRFPDGGIDPADRDQLGAVIELIRCVRPRLLYVPHPGDRSFDHQAGFELCWRAAEMAGSTNYPQWGPEPHWVGTVLGYEVWSPIADPQYGEDITAVLETKLAAVACYRSQSAAAKGRGQADYISPAAACLSGYRGAMSTGGYRECFQVLRLGSVVGS